MCIEAFKRRAGLAIVSVVSNVKQLTIATTKELKSNVVLSLNHYCSAGHEKCPMQNFRDF